MVKIIHLHRGVFVAPQLAAGDFAELKRLGFRSVVNNRPDGEALDQLSSEAAEAAARAQGLAFRYMPLTCTDINDEAVVAAFDRLIEELPQPILFYCRTGTRCATVWVQAAAGRLGVSRSLEIAAQAGYDLDILRDDLIERYGEDRPAEPAPAEQAVA